MNKARVFAFLAVAMCALGALADAANTLITFSTQGPDLYADGQTVKNGEWYALCWSANAAFGGMTSTCEPSVAGDRVLLVASLAEGGKCPTVVFQLDSKVAPNAGRYFIYLLDTRGVDGLPAKAGADGRPACLNAAVATTASAQATSSLGAMTSVTDAALAQGAGGAAWGESAIDEAKVGQPRITAFAIQGDKAVIKVSNLHASVRYNIFAGATPQSITRTTLPAPISAESNDTATFVIDKDQGRFFNVARQPLK